LGGRSYLAALRRMRQQSRHLYSDAQRVRTQSRSCSTRTSA
jgi:hypothetical protein